MDKVSEKLTIFFEELFLAGCLNGYQMESYPCVRLCLEQNQKIMRLLKNYYWLWFSLAVVIDVKEINRNPKWVQRRVWKQL